MDKLLASSLSCCFCSKPWSMIEGPLAIASSLHVDDTQTSYCCRTSNLIKRSEEYDWPLHSVISQHTTQSFLFQNDLSQNSQNSWSVVPSAPPLKLLALTRFHLLPRTPKLSLGTKKQCQVALKALEALLFICNGNHVARWPLFLWNSFPLETDLLKILPLLCFNFSSF